MSQELPLPNSLYINTDIGLKYLNGNRKLYLKVLNSFLNRYRDFEVDRLTEDELKIAMHTLKGLSSTLGMESLGQLATALHQKPTQDLLSEFKQILNQIIYDLDNSKI